MPNQSHTERPLYKDLRQCNWCGKARGPGVTLKRCSNCKVDLFCGEECLRAAWPSHKAKCKANQQALAAHPQDVPDINTLRHWTKVHKPTFIYFAMQELGVVEDPSVGERMLFMVMVRLRPEETRPQCKYEITEAFPYTIAEMGKLADTVREQYRAAKETRGGPEHGTFMLFVMPEGQAPHLIPLGFELGADSLPKHFPHESYVKQINDGRL